MQESPLVDHRQRAFRQGSSHLTRLDVDGDLVVTVLRMEVRRRMVAPLHRNDNAKKPADDWHFSRSLACRPRSPCRRRTVFNGKPRDRRVRVAGLVPVSRRRGGRGRPRIEPEIAGVCHGGSQFSSNRGSVRRRSAAGTCSAPEFRVHPVWWSIATAGDRGRLRSRCGWQFPGSSAGTGQSCHRISGQRIALMTPLRPDRIPAFQTRCQPCPLVVRAEPVFRQNPGERRPTRTRISR